MSPGTGRARRAETSTRETPGTGAQGRVLVIEDHRMLAEALVLSLSARGFDCLVATLGDREAVLAQAASWRPDLVLLDLDLGGADGRELLPRLRTGGARVLVVTGRSDEAALAESVALGASGWVSKSEPFEGLVEAAERAADGHPLISAARQEELVRLGRANLSSRRRLKQQMSGLTQREREVLQALCDGKSADDIADEFIVSIGTVRTHIRGILTKLGVCSQLAAVAKARELAVAR